MLLRDIFIIFEYFEHISQFQAHKLRTYDAQISAKLQLKNQKQASINFYLFPLTFLNFLSIWFWKT